MAPDNPLLRSYRRHTIFMLRALSVVMGGFAVIAVVGIVQAYRTEPSRIIVLLAALFGFSAVVGVFAHLAANGIARDRRG